MPKNGLEKLKNFSMDTQTESLKIALAKKIKQITGEEKEEKSRKEENINKAHIKTGSTQDMVPIKNITNGVIITLDGRYISIVEIAPVNYSKMSNEEKRFVLNNFQSLFKLDRVKWQIKIMNNPANASELVENIQQAGRYGESPQLDESIDHYVNYVNDAGRNGASNTRYFIIFEYEGHERDIERIAMDMYSARIDIDNALKAANSYIITSSENTGLSSFDEEQLDYLYRYFNPITHTKETYKQRIARIVSDYREYNKVAKELGKPEKNITIADMVAPKGMHVTNRNYIYMDGMYYGFIGLTTYPTDVRGAWLNWFNFGNMVDVDVIIKKLPREVVRNSLKVYNTYSQNQAAEAAQKNKVEKFYKYRRKLENNQRVEQMLNAGHDLYDVAIILTVRASTARQLGNYMRSIKTVLKARVSINVETCYDCAEEYFAMTMPLLYITKPFRRIKHNFLTEDLASLFPMTAYNLYDPRGWVPGLNKENDSLCAINLFDTQKYNNANFVILGVPGSGKTFTLKLMSTRLYYNGVDCYFIIPKKGYEFLPCCEMTGGTYVSMVPMSGTCINIMELRAEKKLNADALSESVVLDNRSILSKKITSICTWMSLLTKGATNDITLNSRLGSVLTQIYARYGINEDNDSIYERDSNGNITSKIKKMPILQDLYDELIKIPEFKTICIILEQFITGTYRNYNGQTNIDLSSKFICFDCDEDNIDKSVHSAVMYIAFDFCYNRVKSPSSGKSIIVMDEVWKLMQTRDSAEQVQNMVKLVRGYLSATCIATQEIEDLLAIEGGYGKSVINDSATKLILNTEKNGLDKIKSLIDINDDDCTKIQKYNVGNGMLISRGQKTEIVIQPSAYEAMKLSDKTRRAQNK